MIELSVLLAGRLFMLALASDPKAAKPKKKSKPGTPLRKKVRRWLRRNRFAGELVLLLAVLIALAKELT